MFNDDHIVPAYRGRDDLLRLRQQGLQNERVLPKFKLVVGILLLRGVAVQQHLLVQLLAQLHDVPDGLSTVSASDKMKENAEEKM